eukprot:3676031-Rhodomonas_salina.2
MTCPGTGGGRGEPGGGRSARRRLAGPAPLRLLSQWLLLPHSRARPRPQPRPCRVCDPSVRGRGDVGDGGGLAPNFPARGPAAVAPARLPRHPHARCRRSGGGNRLPAAALRVAVWTGPEPAAGRDVAAGGALWAGALPAVGPARSQTGPGRA